MAETKEELDRLVVLAAPKDADIIRKAADAERRSVSNYLLNAGLERALTPKG